MSVYIPKTKYKLPVDDIYCLYYLSAILVIILITRRTQRSLIQAITCTYKKMLVFPIFPLKTYLTEFT